MRIHPLELMILKLKRQLPRLSRLDWLREMSNEQCLDCLQKFSGLDFGSDVNAWSKWWTQEKKRNKSLFANLAADYSELGLQNQIEGTPAMPPQARRSAIINWERARIRSAHALVKSETIRKKTRRHSPSEPQPGPMKLPPKMERDCPQCGLTYGSVVETGVCPSCNHRFVATPTLIALAGKLGPSDEAGRVVAIATYHKLPALQTLDQPIHDLSREALPEKIAREHCVIPLLVNGIARYVVADPLEPRLMETLSQHAKGPIEFAVAQYSEIRRRIDESYGVTNEESARVYRIT